VINVTYFSETGSFKKRNPLTQTHPRTPEENTRELELVSEIIDHVIKVCKDDLRLEER